MKFCVIGSGSRGNMTYIETKQNKILIDCGISFLDANARLKEDGLSIENIDKIFITHEHDDHIHFLATILKRTNATVYISKKSFNNICEDLQDKIIDNNYDVRFIEKESRYVFEDFEVLTLKLSHDAKDILGFVFIEDGKQLIYATDTGIFPLKYESILKTADALIIEANHNVEKLINSPRPLYLKQRILSANGHLSNQVTKELLERVLDKQKVVILAHVSEECNSEEAIKHDIIDKMSFFKGEIVIASQKLSSKVFEI